jgi:hypothetical protein
MDYTDKFLCYVSFERLEYVSVHLTKNATVFL